MHSVETFLSLYYNIIRKGGETVDINVVMQAISTFGFPIVMCCAMAYYVKYVGDKQRDEIRSLNTQHKEELLDVVKAIDNNTVALTKLCEKMEKE